jgi:uncharacterized membrane protein
MPLRSGLVFLIVLTCLLWSSIGNSGVGASPVDEPKKTDDKKEEMTPTFKNDVQPLLNNACMNCHSGKRKKGGVDLSSYDAVIKSVKANEPDKSRLIKSVTGQGAKLMPPKTGLGDDQVKVLKAWIAAGAKND